MRDAWKRIQVRISYNYPRSYSEPHRVSKVGVKFYHEAISQGHYTQSGDEQNHVSNVKADMTDWFMHKKYKEFKELSIHAEAVANQMIEDPVAMFTFDCWGAVYRKGDETVIHSHWGNLWSWCYYLKIPNDSPPFRFEDTFQSGTNDVTSFDIYPEVDDLLIFPSWFKHSVPKMECDGERIMIAGNIQTVRPVPWPTPIKPTSISWSLENYD